MLVSKIEEIILFLLNKQNFRFFYGRIEKNEHIELLIVFYSNIKGKKSQINPDILYYKTAPSVQLPYLASHPL